MAIKITMPALSPSMEKGTLAKWLVAEGDLVKPGDLLAEIETDKTTMELEASDTGRIMRLIVSEGTDDVAVGTLIALLSDEREVASGAPLDEVTPLSTGPAKAAPTLVIADAAKPILSRNAPEVIVRPSQSPADNIQMSPLAQRVAEAKGIDIDRITGSGSNGRIILADLGIKPLAGLKSVPTPLPSSDPISTGASPAGLPVQSAEIVSMRSAPQPTRNKQEVPHFCLTTRCNLDALLKLRAELNVSLAGRAIELSVDDMLVKAMALALAEAPDVNVKIGGVELYRLARADIAMAVPLDDGGLIAPIIRDAGSKSLSAIAEASRTLVAKAREGKLVSGDCEGGTASISNLGMFGIDEMIPAINPPQAFALGIAAGIEQPWRVGDGIGLATIMAATASFDHRAIDVPAGARFMKAFRELVERPILLCS